MLNMPILKFEKSCNYLTEQLTLQNNNKQLILDIISNIGLILNDSSDENAAQYEDILEISNDFLKTLSNNITTIEQLNLEIKNIIQELTDVLSDQKKNTKTKEFYIAAFSNIKHNIIIYSKKFQEIEAKLSSDNLAFNEFINENNFKYNFVSIDNSTNNYTFTGFSINDTNEVKNITIGEVSLTEANNVPEETKTDTTAETIEEANSFEDTTSKEFENMSNDELLDLIDELDNYDIDEDEPTSDVENKESDKIENSTTAELEDISNDELLNLIDELDDSVIEEITPTSSDKAEILSDTDTLEKSDNIEESENLSEKERKIDQLTSEFKEILMNLSNSDFNSESTSNAVLSLFKDFLPEEHLAEISNDTNKDETDEVNATYSDDDSDDDLEVDLYNFEAANEYYNNHSIEKYLVKNFEKFGYLNYRDYEYFEEPQEIVSHENISTNLNEPLLECSNETVDEEVFIENDEDIVDVEDSLLEEILQKTPDTTNNLSNPIINSSESVEEDIFNEYSYIKPSSSFNLETFSQNYKPDTSNKEEIEFLYNEVEKLIENDSYETDIIDNEINYIPEELSLEESFKENTSLDTLNIESEETSTLSEISDINITENVFPNINLETDSVGNILDIAELVTDIESEPQSNSMVDNYINNVLSVPSLLKPDTSSNKELDCEEDIENNLDEENSLLEEALLDQALLDEELGTSDEKIEEPNTLSENITEYQKDVSKSKNMSKISFEEKLQKIQNATEDNKTLLISERLQKIYLPYKISELVSYIESYPGSYTSLKDVVEQEFILPFDYFKKHPSKSRFTETYNLLKNREGRNFIKSVSYAFRLLKKSNLNPAIIASCKTQHELDSYIYYLDSNNLHNFKFFNVIYEVNPM